VGRIIGSALVLAAVGLGVGYLIFGRNVAGEFIPLDQLLTLPGDGAVGFLQQAGQELTGIQDARQNILISGAVGLAVGAVIGAFAPRGRRR
jgi:hypothetical protein